VYLMLSSDYLQICTGSSNSPCFANESQISGFSMDDCTKSAHVEAMRPFPPAPQKAHMIQMRRSWGVKSDRSEVVHSIVAGV
jgi:hypothetical protein